MTTDCEFVAAIRAGDTTPWGPVFDRYRDNVWQIALSVTRNHSDSEDVVQATFLKAVESLDQLRDPEKLRPWLLSIARSKALDRVRRRKETLTDAPPDPADLSPGLDHGLHQQDVADLVASAFDGLEPRDRAALELAERQGLSGDELADALGVTRDNAYALVHNARSRFSLSVESIVVARRGQDDCADLRDVLGTWDGRLDPLLRKRVARHIQQCETCAVTREREVTPAALLNLMPLVALPALWADKVRAETIEASAATGGSGALIAHGAIAASGTKVAALVAAAVVAVGTAVGVIALGSGNDGTELAEASALAALPVATLTSAEPTATTRAPTPTAEPDDVVVVELDETLEPTATPGLAPQTLCQLAEDLTQTAGGGPASGSSADFEAYIRSTNALVAQVASSAEATDTLRGYAVAYQSLVDEEVWNSLPIASNPELDALADAFESELLDVCPNI